MTALVWNDAGERLYENGLDRGVLYLPDGTGVVWNGLTEVTKKFDRKSDPVSFDGQKIHNVVTMGNYGATLKAITYPDQFSDIEGDYQIRTGVFMTEQPPKCFGLCYRSSIGDDLVGDEKGYKINVVYNIIAIPSDRTYETRGSSAHAVEFEWDLSAVPPDALGFRPTAHIIIDSRTIDPELLEELEAILYGDDDTESHLPSFSDFMDVITSYFRILIEDLGDGTWRATDLHGDYISLAMDGYTFTITDTNAIYSDANTYTLSTVDNKDDITPEP